MKRKKVKVNLMNINKILTINFFYNVNNTLNLLKVV